ncbi:MAG: GNAT family N-acetyltransferase [Rhodospirillaceae bacterium]|nr:GNAT family N-acetyltransferase [Rhodospirillaceae bacterium]
MKPAGATPLHAGVIAGLHGACFDGPHDTAWDEKAIFQILAMPGAFGFIAGGADGPCGFVLGRTAADECEIISIGVIAAARRSGVGRDLLVATVDHARAAGATRMYLEAAENNEAARGFYEISGFEPAGRRARYYGRGSDSVDALVYALELKAK